MMVLFFDTETSGTIDWKTPLDSPNQPDVIQLAAILSDETTVYHELVCLVNPSDINPGWVMTPGAEAVHGITRERVLEEGRPAREVYAEFMTLLPQARELVCHNTAFDSRLLGTAFNRLQDASGATRILNSQYYCTMKKSTKLCRLPGPYGYKWPKLSELHRHLFNEDFDGAHDALADVLATRRCYYELRRRGL